MINLKAIRSKILRLSSPNSNSSIISSKERVPLARPQELASTCYACA
jgi:hypothetical protein